MSQLYQTSQIIILCKNIDFFIENCEKRLNECVNIQCVAITAKRFLNNKFHYRRDTLFVICPSVYEGCESFIRKQSLGTEFQICQWDYNLRKLMEALPCTTTENA